jgi:hypothetical protein
MYKSNALTKAQAIHDVTCGLLRGIDSHILTLDELRVYQYNVGCALHNLPMTLLKKGEGLEININSVIDDIHWVDLSGTADTWSNNAVHLANGYGIKLPRKPRIMPKHVKDGINIKRRKEIRSNGDDLVCESKYEKLISKIKYQSNQLKVKIFS